MITNNNNPEASRLYPEYLIDKVNDSLDYYIEKYKEAPDILKKAIKYSIKNGGKRFRPILCMITAMSLGKDFKIIMPTACAIEFIHTYSLIHDDLPSIDNDDFRRGKPAVHKKFGEDIAILTGDALFSEAFNIITKYQVCDAETKIKITGEITEATGVEGMAAGQIIDVFYTGRNISKEVLEIMHMNKTGKLITASVRCAAIICGASRKIIENLTDYSRNIGLAFQITDDILDVTSDMKTIGKAVSKDRASKKNTYPDMWGISESKKMAEMKIRKSIEIIEGMDIMQNLLIDMAKFVISRKV